jgi:pilus assembly protein CpaB
MKPKTMILMVVAIVCGLGASYMTSRLLAEREEQPPQVIVQEVPKVKLLVAKKALPLGQTVKDANKLFVEKTFSRDDAPKDVVTDYKALEGKTLKRALRAGDHVFADDIREGPVTLDVPPGMRAVGLRVTIDAIAAGFASLPGSKVDIIWNVRGNNPDQTFSVKLLQNVLVLAADTQDGQTPDGGRALPASVVTLALSPKDTERVSLASENGNLRLVLRQPGDEKIQKVEITKLSDILRKDNEPEQVRTEDVPEAVPPVGEPRQPAQPGAEEVEDSKWEPIPAPQRRQHVVWYRQGDRVWKEVFELEESGAPLDEEPTPQVGSAPADAPTPPLLRGPAIDAGRAKGG